MDLRTFLSHSALSIYYSSKLKNFKRASSNLEMVQRSRLQSILRSVAPAVHWQKLGNGLTYEDFRNQVPIAEYSDYSTLIEHQRKTGESLLSVSPKRWEPTSGSTHLRKWIPYTAEHLNEMNIAAAAWLGDLYSNFPKLKGGKHYWSLSWLPEELRNQVTLNDEDLFPFYQRWLLKNAMLAPAKLSHLPTLEQSQRATALSLLAAEDLRLVFVWSPTFFLQILNYISKNWLELSSLLREGKWGVHEDIIRQYLGRAPRRDLTGIRPSDWSSVWPKLNLISAWESSSSKPWAEALKNALPGVAFQAKGLWATEGVVTIPIDGQLVLAYQSHFYEFIDLKSSTVVPSWQVVPGEMYQPVISTSNGLLRYKISDQIKCTEFWNQIPCFEFMNRIHSTDLVGEKISIDFVESIFSELKDCQPYCLIATRNPKPRYFLLCKQDLGLDVDLKLSKMHHYRLARELGQLEAAKSLPCSNPLDFLSQIRKTSAEGQIKMELLLEVDQIPVKLLEC